MTPNGKFGFLECEDGAVTIDWVVITGSIVGLCIMMYTFIGDDSANLSQEIADEFETRKIPSYLD